MHAEANLPWGQSPAILYQQSPAILRRRSDADRIEVERFFSVEKRCCGAGLIMTKLSKTTLGSIALSVLVANLFGVQLPLLFLFYFMDAPDGASSFHMLEIEDEAA